MEPIKIDDIARFTFLSNVAFNCTGDLACFVVHQAAIEQNTYYSNLWIHDCKRNHLFQLTTGNTVSKFIWLNDGKHVLFAANREKQHREKEVCSEDLTTFYQINTDGGEARKAFQIPRKVSDIKQIDNDTFLFSSPDNPYRKDVSQLSRGKAAEMDYREEKDYEVLEEIPFWSNGAGFTSLDRQRLYIYHADTAKYEALTDRCLNVDTFALNDNKTQVVFTASNYQGKMTLENAVYLCDLPTKTVRRLTPRERFLYDYVGFIDDATIICAGTNMQQYGINENQRFYIIDIVTGSRRCITPDLRISTGNSVGSDCRYGSGPSQQIDSGYLYFTTTEGNSSFLNRIDKTGNIERLTYQNGSVDCFAAKNDQILMVALRNLRLQELYRLEGHSEVQISHFNDWVQTDRTIAELEHLTIPIDSDLSIDGWVIKPVDFDPSRKYPAILDIHGGPKTVYGEVFYHEMQYWANEGFFVFFCNPRGSDGKGDEFADIRGKYGTIDYDDIMKFTDVVLEKHPNIDRNRLGVTGGSYGGFMVNWIIGHTNRFAAAASQRSISNWISKFATTDIGYYFVEDQNGATPWNNPDKLWFHSPLRYADQAKTPTLFIHSDEDYRCWLAEGLQMFTALKYHGVEARFCLFHGENHELSRSGKPKHRIRRLAEITDWFSRYLKPNQQASGSHS